MKWINSRNIVLITIASIAVGACGPVASSVSKFGGGGGDSSPTKNLNANDSTKSDAVQKTVVIKVDEFKSKWASISLKPTILVTDPEIVDVKASFSANMAATLDSTGNPKIDGSEGTLSGPKSRIRLYLVVKSETEITKLRLNEITLGLVWKKAEAEEEHGHWELSIISPPVTGDPANDTDAENIRHALVQQLIGVAVQFEADL